jgi:hypothetical protein
VSVTKPVHHNRNCALEGFEGEVMSAITGEKTKPIAAHLCLDRLEISDAAQRFCRDRRACPLIDVI